MMKVRMACFVAQLGMGLAASVAHAQSTSDAVDERYRLDQVTVTSSKREQQLLDVPYAVTPISAEEISDRGVRDLRDMQSAVPSLYITSNSPGMTRLQLRGVSTAQGLPTVGSYLDETNLDQGFAQRSPDIPLVDMQRVEVLRGPQGTLYGASSLGGTIRYLTANPRLDAMSISGEGGVSHVAGALNQGSYANVVGNVPISDGVAGLRIVLGTESIPGWIDNRVTGQNDVNDLTRQYLRLKGLVRLGSNVDVSLLVYSSQLKQDNPNNSNSRDVTSALLPSPTNDRTSIANLVVNADLGPFSIVSSTAYLYRGLDDALDVSALIPVPGGAVYRQDESSRAWSQEVRANSNSTGPFSWTGGLYYRHIDSFVTTTIPQIGSRSQGTQPANSRQYAVFGEATYAILKSLSATVGLRYFQDKQTAERFSAPAASASQTFHSTSPRFNLLWRYAPEAAVYTNVAKGFRSGGFNAFTDTPLTYGPETLWQYEVGNRAALFGGRVTYDAAVYYTKYRDIQGYLLSNIPLPHLIIQNTGEASGIGYDLSVRTHVTDRLSWDVTFGYNGMSYDVDNLDRSKGDPLNYIPKKTFGTSLMYRYAWFGTGVPGMARIDYQYASPAKLIVRNQPPGVFPIDPVHTLNARVGVEMKRWQVYLEGRNLTNQYQIVSPAVGAQAEDTRPVPRSIGVSARAEF